MSLSGCRHAFGMAFGALALLIFAAGASPSQGKGLPVTILYDFCPQGGCSRTNSPAGLLADGNGNLFGTNADGGTHGGGTIFELSFNKISNSWQYSELYDFCALTSCADGKMPYATLIEDGQGNLYGTTSQGGDTGWGIVFEFTTNHVLNLLYSFCPDGTTCSDGATPVAPLTYSGASSGKPYDGTSPLYGATYHGGTGEGAIFALSPGGGPTAWPEAVIYNFVCCNQVGYDATSLVMDLKGNLIGTTALGGLSGGAIFELSPSGGGNWTATDLHDFCQNENCADGYDPRGQPILDRLNNVYGVTSHGGETGFGLAYKLTPQGVGSPFVVLHNFCADSKCKEGMFPYGGLVRSPSGELFGTTAYGAYANSGALFMLHKSKTRVLHTFCKKSGCTDGSHVLSNLAVDKSGNLFGRTTGDTPNGEGAAFELTP